MDTYLVEVDAKLIVRWHNDEQRFGHHELRVTVSRSYVRDSIPTSQQQRRLLGEEELEDLSQVAAFGSPEIAPLNEKEGRLLRVGIEDALGDRVSEDGLSSDEPEEMDPDSLHKVFIVPGSGTAFVSVEAEIPEAWALCQRMLADIQADMHNK